MQSSMLCQNGCGVQSRGNLYYPTLECGGRLPDHNGAVPGPQILANWSELLICCVCLMYLWSEMQQLQRSFCCELEITFSGSVL